MPCPCPQPLAVARRGSSLPRRRTMRYSKMCTALAHASRHLTTLAPRVCLYVHSDKFAIRQTGAPCATHRSSRRKVGLGGVSGLHFHVGARRARMCPGNNALWNQSMIYGCKACFAAHKRATARWAAAKLVRTHIPIHTRAYPVDERRPIRRVTRVHVKRKRGAQWERPT